ncbi:hypothetical protein [Pectinatus frisingensis]|uniref:hypothetical protein n=1 Tax=Pectinatus frisingensis TaxID=865 RepID=UPI0018C49B1A|nr:hypothetical protein [Pectinatus frisingensis]
MKSQVLNMRYPVGLIERIDKLKEQKCFNTRTQTIIFLIQFALEQLEKGNDSSPT